MTEQINPHTISQKRIEFASFSMRDMLQRLETEREKTKWPTVISEDYVITDGLLQALIDYELFGLLKMESMSSSQGEEDMFYALRELQQLRLENEALKARVDALDEVQ